MSLPTPRVWAEIDTGALQRNIRRLRADFGLDGKSRMMAVVKADAYGHGLNLIVRRCTEFGVTDFGVACVAEGAAVRAAAPSASVYILGASLPAEADAIVSQSLIPLVSTLELGEALSAAACRQHAVCEVHLDIDTGMGRTGASVEDAPSLLWALDRLPGLTVTGAATHFARADEMVDDSARQYAAFVRFIAGLGERGARLLLHTDNSPAVLSLPPDTRHGLIRPGLLLYGIEPAPGMFAAAGVCFDPVLSLRARIVLCRPLPGGSPISYGSCYIVPPTGGVYATLPIGYGDGFSRRFSGCGSALIRGRHAPIRGRVCMDQLVVEVTGIGLPHTGEVATLIGRDGDAELTAGALADIVGATPHELTTCLTGRVPDSNGPRTVRWSSDMYCLSPVPKLEIHGGPWYTVKKRYGRPLKE